jgi:hypothetical protein
LKNPESRFRTRFIRTIRLAGTSQPGPRIQKQSNNEQR